MVGTSTRYTRLKSDLSENKEITYGTDQTTHPHILNQAQANTTIQAITYYYRDHTSLILSDDAY